MDKRYAGDNGLMILSLFHEYMEGEGIDVVTVSAICSLSSAMASSFALNLLTPSVSSSCIS